MPVQTDDFDALVVCLRITATKCLHRHPEYAQHADRYVQPVEPGHRKER